MIFTSDIEIIKKLELKFIRIDKTEFDWTTEYINPEDDSKWLKLRLRSEYHGGGYPVMMKKTGISTDFLIKIILSSDNIEQISVGSALLEYFESSDRIEFRTKLIDSLEKHYSIENNRTDEFEKLRLQSIIENSTIYDDTNRREIVGKNDAEITADYYYFKKIAERTEKLQEL
ncbi:hypothetical protein [Aureitalea marina]|nr:hypothetical protein [Aureitalea marina]